MSPVDDLASLRRSIDNIDTAVVALLGERFSLTEKVGLIKAEYGMPAEDMNREREQQAKYAQLASNHHLTAETVSKVMDTIISLVKVRHAELLAAKRG